jgi:hypothetical protein
MTNPASDAAAAALARIAASAGSAPPAPPTPEVASAAKTQEVATDALAALMARMDEMAKQVAGLMAENKKLVEAAAPKEDKRELREFCHRIPGSRVIICKKGPNNENIAEEHYFYNGRIVTADPVLQDALLEMARSVGSPVFEGSTPTADLEASQAQELVVRMAEESIDKLGAEAKAMQLGRG